MINREDAHILDVREVDEYAARTLAGSRSVIPGGKLAEQLASWKSSGNKPIIVCCASGMHSNKVLRRAEETGFHKLHNLAGGVDAAGRRQSNDGAGDALRRSARSRSCGGRCRSERGSRSGDVI